MRCTPAPTEITMNELCSVTPHLVNHSLLATGTVRWRTHTHSDTQAQKIKSLKPDAFIIFICRNEDKLQEIQKLFKQLHTPSQSPSTKQPCSQAQDSTPLSSASSSSSSTSCCRNTRRNSVPSSCSNESAAEGQNSSSEDSLKLVSRDKMSPSTSPLVRLITQSTVI